MPLRVLQVGDIFPGGLGLPRITGCFRFTAFYGVVNCFFCLSKGFLGSNLGCIMDFSINKTPVTIFGLLLSTGLLLILFLSIPVLIFEWSTANLPDISFKAISTGSLVNLTEKQLIADSYQIISSSSRTVILQKQDTLLIDKNSIPLKINVQFNSVLPDVDIFREPFKIYFLYSSGNDSIIAEYLNRVMHQELSDAKKSGQKSSEEYEILPLLDSGYAAELPYNMKGNKYYFTFGPGFQPEVNSVHTTIFSGKLFLMLKFYVCKFYSIVPVSFRPMWFSKLMDLN